MEVQRETLETEISLKKVEVETDLKWFDITRLQWFDPSLRKSLYSVLMLDYSRYF